MGLFAYVQYGKSEYTLSVVLFRLSFKEFLTRQFLSGHVGLPGNPSLLALHWRAAGPSVPVSISTKLCHFVTAD